MRIAQAIDVHAEGGQAGPQPVVQIAAEPFAFLFAGDDQAFLRLSQCLHQRGGVQRLTELAGHGIEQAPIVGPQGCAGPADRADQGAP